MDQNNYLEGRQKKQFIHRAHRQIKVYLVAYFDSNIYFYYIVAFLSFFISDFFLKQWYVFIHLLHCS